MLPYPKAKRACPVLKQGSRFQNHAASSGKGQQTCPVPEPEKVLHRYIQQSSPYIYIYIYIYTARAMKTQEQQSLATAYFIRQQGDYN